MVVPLVFLPILLTGCATSGNASAPLPATPDGLIRCAVAPVPAIPGARGTGLTKAQVAETLADQRAAALDKDRCAKAWAAFYDDVLKSVN